MGTLTIENKLMENVKAIGKGAAIGIGIGGIAGAIDQLSGTETILMSIWGFSYLALNTNLCSKIEKFEVITDSPRMKALGVGGASMVSSYIGIYNLLSNYIN
jgi:hypothetical protein|tara:strand:- start:325 stop:630 length:306 start_codon:yes stop_codon:yes gene_type:complete